MTHADPSTTTRALAVRASSELSDSSRTRRSVRSGATKQWQPPEGLAPEDVLAVIDAAATERDRLMLRVLWATGARISEVLALRPMDVRRDSLVLPNLKNPSVAPSACSSPPVRQTCLANSCSGLESTNSPMISRCPTRASAQLAHSVAPTPASKLGPSCGRLPTAPTSGCWHSEPHDTVRQGNRHLSILTCSATRGCGRSCGRPGACRLRRSRRAGLACRWLT
jgi:hypothetical protein